MKKEILKTLLVSLLIIVFPFALKAVGGQLLIAYVAAYDTAEYIADDEQLEDSPEYIGDSPNKATDIPPSDSYNSDLEDPAVDLDPYKGNLSDDDDDAADGDSTNSGQLPIGEDPPINENDLPSTDVGEDPPINENDLPSTDVGEDPPINENDLQINSSSGSTTNNSTPSSSSSNLSGSASGNPWQTGLENAKNSGLPGGSISEIIFSLAGWLLIILGSIAVIGFVIAGILYLTSAGDEDRMKKAKQGMIYAIIGVVVGLLGYVIVQAVDTWLRANDTF
jgi:hypothetical protein